MNVSVLSPRDVRASCKLAGAAADGMSPIPGLETVGLLGGGVIGGGWAARFLLNGVDVRLLDPDPEAPRKVGELSTTPAAPARR